MLTNPITTNLLEKDIHDAIVYAFNEFYSKPYTDVHICKDDAYIIGASGRRIERPTHNIRNALTRMAAAPAVLKALQDKYPERYKNIDENELRRILIAILFTNSGRQSEANFQTAGGKPYTRYRENAGENFKKYVTEHLGHLFSPQDVEKYQDFIVNQGHKHNRSGPELDIINMTHGLDLMRIYIPEQFERIEESIKQQCGQELGKTILDFARQLVLVTGEKVFGYNVTDESCYINLTRFEECSTNPDACIKHLSTVVPPNLPMLPVVPQVQPVQPVPTPVEPVAKTPQQAPNAEAIESQKILLGYLDEQKSALEAELSKYVELVYQQKQQTYAPQLMAKQEELLNIHRIIDEATRELKSAIEVRI